ncbi:type II toxin-antitoxin system PemK/MazF family toxin [Pseudolysinimonas sp.]|uniref:type II toxin-antitoxin system PemK/MazF family toxin n=1 Tax=Pseudolysinimonas sp. TaxID=2680009 RepID=UPI00286ABF62|nr:type II toxin-antitoxin system PemK/MazF family toxin [Pseudolysinimonas sp.]
MGAPAVGDVVLVPFPFSDLTGHKLRPAFVAANAEHGDLILCQITSRPWGHRSAVTVSGSDVAASGLARESYLRPDKLFTADARLIVRRIGSLSPAVTSTARAVIAGLFA